MGLGLVGKKVGMTRVFNDDGVSTPVTVVQVEPNRVTQVKQDATDGYTALQLTTGTRRVNRVSKPLRGHFAKAGTEAGRALWELRVDIETAEQYPAGSELTVEVLQEGQKVDVRGTTIGRGFAGVMRRHGFGGGRATHGNSKAHRKPGSIGQNQDPGRVFKGKKMAGHMGAERVTTQGLEVVRVDVERNLLLIKGAVPGAPGGDVIVRPTTKSRS